MTKKKALQMAVFVGVMVFVFTSFTLWGLFIRIDPTGNDNELMGAILPFTPFVLSGAFSLVAFSLAHQAFRGHVEKKTDLETSDND
jgi:hypothetical protein